MSARRQSFALVLSCGHQLTVTARTAPRSCDCRACTRWVRGGHVPSRRVVHAETVEAAS